MRIAFHVVAAKDAEYCCNSMFELWCGWLCRLAVSVPPEDVGIIYVLRTPHSEK